MYGSPECDTDDIVKKVQNVKGRSGGKPKAILNEASVRRSERLKLKHNNIFFIYLRAHLFPLFPVVQCITNSTYIHLS